MGDPKGPLKFEVNKGRIQVLCPCHGGVIAESKGDLNKDRFLIVEAGKGRSRYCKADAVFEYPEVQTRIFDPET
jgi:hypothetical protein